MRQPKDHKIGVPLTRDQIRMLISACYLAEFSYSSFEKEYEDLRDYLESRLQVQKRGLRTKAKKLKN